MRSRRSAMDRSPTGTCPTENTTFDATERNGARKTTSNLQFPCLSFCPFPPSCVQFNSFSPSSINRHGSTRENGTEGKTTKAGGREEQAEQGRQPHPVPLARGGRAQGTREAGWILTARREEPRRGGRRRGGLYRGGGAAQL
jgi:hypothetical protein